MRCSASHIRLHQLSHIFLYVFLRSLYSIFRASQYVVSYLPGRIYQPVYFLNPFTLHLYSILVFKYDYIVAFLFFLDKFSPCRDLPPLTFASPATLQNSVWNSAPLWIEILISTDKYPPSYQWITPPLRTYAYLPPEVPWVLVETGGLVTTFSFPYLLMSIKIMFFSSDRSSL